LNLQLNNITKSFAEKQVLKGISLNIKSGTAFGLLGRNGAGKTTTIRIIMRVFNANSGEILLNGKPIAKSNLKFGYLPEERGLYPKALIADQLKYIGELRGMTAKDAAASAQKWLGRLELSHEAGKKLSTLSKGNQQKVQLIATLIHNPDIIILDEPFSGLDPVNSQSLKDIINEQIAAGKIVLFSSHQMGYVEQFCDHIAIINNGEIVLDGNLREIKRAGDRSKLKIDIGAGDVAHYLQNESIQAFCKDVTVNNSIAVITLNKADEAQKLLQTLILQNVPLEKYEILEPTLEEIFIKKAGAL